MRLTLDNNRPTNPYFLTNKDWYYYDNDEGIYKLTKKGLSIKKVVESYNNYYGTPFYDENGELCDA